MRQKTAHVIAFFFVLVTMASMFSLYLPKSYAQEEDVVVIPNEAIRLRILANSNSEQDQEIKRTVRNRVNAQITEWVRDLTSIEAAREKIIANLDTLETTAKEVLEEKGVNQKVQIRFGEVDFPTKLYGHFLYPAGKYEAVLITLGEGAGANWWCVLFPPLCFLDFSSGTAVSEEVDDKEINGSDDTKIDQTTYKETDVTAKSNSDDDSNEQLYVEENEEDVEVKFFLVEFIENIIDLFK